MSNPSLLLLTLLCTGIRSYLGFLHNNGVVRSMRLNVASSTSSKLNGPQFDHSAFVKGFFTCTDEVCEELLTSESSIPRDIEGTYFRNGPAKFEAGDEPFVHSLDGDGMVSAITFKDGRAFFRNRFVQTEEYLAEKKANRVLYRGAFGTQKKGFLANFFELNIKNTVR